MDTRTGLEALHEQAIARIADIDLVGVSAVADTVGNPLYDRMVTLLPGAKSFVVLGMELFREVLDLVTPEKVMGEAAARDLIGPHMDYQSGRMNRGLYELAKVYRGAGYKALPLPSQGTPSDARFLDGLLSFKHAAVQAGLGVIGYSSLLLTPKYGPRLRLACLLTDAELPATRNQHNSPCDECAGLCIEACPAGALSLPESGRPYAMNKYACSAFRNGSGCCMACVSVCPAGG
jgi:epoxyqueuosine reductase